MKNKIIILYYLLFQIALHAQTGSFETSIDSDAGQGSNNGINANIMLDGFIITGARHLLLPHKCRQHCRNL